MSDNKGLGRFFKGDESGSAGTSGVRDFAGADKTIIDNDKHDCLFWANYYGQKQIIKLFSKEPAIKEKKGK
mgnify:CR=1 FL=1